MHSIKMAYWYDNVKTYFILKAFNSLLSRSSGMTLNKPSYKCKPITRHDGSIIPMMPVSHGRPLRSWKT